MNRGVKGLGIAVVVIGAAVVAAPLVLQGVVRDAMTRRIEAATGLPTAIGTARLAVFPQPHVEANDIRIGSAAAPGAVSGTIAALRFDLSFATLLGGPAEISAVALERPAITITRTGGAPLFGHGPTAAPAGLTLDGLSVSDGHITYVDDRRQGRLDLAHVSFRVHAPGAGAPLDVTGTADAGGSPAAWRLAIESPEALTAGRASAASAEIGAPGGVDPASLSGHLRLSNGRIEIPDFAASMGASSLGGSGSVDLSGAAPMIKAALRAPRIDLGNVSALGGIALPADRNALRLTDAAVTLDVDEADAGPLRATALRGKATLTDGQLRLGLLDARLYGGSVKAEAAVDAAQALPRPTAHASLSDLDVSPLVANLPTQARFSGRLDADLVLTSAGASRDEIVANLAGTARFAVHDAAITGVDVPSIIRSVASYLPPAWQRMTNRIDIQTLTASFQIAQGVATTADVHAVSPVVELNGKGDVDLGAQRFDLSFEPKILTAPATTAAKPPSPGTLGVAILVQGPWSAPRLSADISNAMRDPQQTLDTLQTLGQQMLGQQSGGDAKGGAIQPQDVIKGLNGLFGGMKEGRQASGGPPRNRDGSATVRRVLKLFDAP